LATATREDVMSELALEDTPDFPAAAHDAARGEAIYITEHGRRLAAIVPVDYASELDEDLADAQAARESLADPGENIPWEQVKTEAGP
jgi:antitoxin (DNA-binding transcriptional repressor) of toxin-antitoxin stability system